MDSVCSGAQRYNQALLPVTNTKADRTGWAMQLRKAKAGRSAAGLASYSV